MAWSVSVFWPNRSNYRKATGGGSHKLSWRAQRVVVWPRPFISFKLISEICLLMGIKEVNTTAYHPQTDGLVERFNRTLLDMLAKKVKPGGQDWDLRLPFILFAYRTTVQQSTLESPFFLLYRRDPQLPVEAALCATVARNSVCIDDDDPKPVCSLEAGPRECL